jgi:glycosyltransferase involved in cell wall biosynthesis
LRILHLGKFFPPYPGGIERHLADLGTAQAAAGLAVAALVHASPGDRTPRRWVEHGLRIEAVPCHGQLVFAPLSPSWPLRLRRLLRDFRPDLLHVHVPNPSAFWLLASRAARRLPWVVHWHADIPQDSGRLGLQLGYPLYRRFEHALNARAARIVATSEPYLQASAALRPWRDRCRVIPLGIGAAAPAAPDAPAWPAGGLRLLAVGRLSYYKGFDVLLDALARVPAASLLLIGDGELAAPLRAQVARLGLGARVRFAGKVDDATLEAAYRACDLFCLPSIDRAEAFGIVLLEAMRAGRALLASDIPGSGVGSVVRAGETGELVPPRDVEALAKALAGFAAEPAKLAAYGSAARHCWERDYRIDAVTQQWTALYRDVLAAPTAG